MGFITVLFFMLMIVANIVIYKRHHIKFNDTENERKETYPLSFPTRLFEKAKYFLYLGVMVHLVSFACQKGDGTPSIPQFLTGAIMGMAGVWVLYASLKTLGVNFSPCNKGYLPEERVKTGPYRYMDHPIYYANMMQMAGVLVAVPGILMMGIFSVFVIFIYFAIKDEENAFRTYFKE
ncbi:MAG: hypothetical protein KJ737_11635 [Proteobacteria bacterium]|nr:hypothetical protein [Pseudomonadota bacterium]